METISNQKSAQKSRQSKEKNGRISSNRHSTRTSQTPSVATPFSPSDPDNLSLISEKVKSH